MSKEPKHPKVVEIEAQMKDVALLKYEAEMKVKLWGKLLEELSVKLDQVKLRHGLYTRESLND